MSTRRSNIDKLHLRLRRYPSHERLVLLRNLGYGGAAICLAVLVGLTQVGAKDSALKITVICASVALPAWLMLGAIFEYYIFLGKESYPHLRTNSVNRFLQLWMFVG